MASLSLTFASSMGLGLRRRTGWAGGWTSWVSERSPPGQPWARTVPSWASLGAEGVGLGHSPSSPSAVSVGGHGAGLGLCRQTDLAHPSRLPPSTAALFTQPAGLSPHLPAGRVRLTFDGCEVPHEPIIIQALTCPGIA